MPILIIRTPKTWESQIHIPFYFLVISFSIYIFHKRNFMNKLSEQKFRNYPRISPVWTGLKLDSAVRMVLASNTGCGGRIYYPSTVKLFQYLSCGLNAFDRTRIEFQTGLKRNSGTKLCCCKTKLAQWVDSNWVDSLSSTSWIKPGWVQLWIRLGSGLE